MCWGLGEQITRCSLSLSLSLSLTLSLSLSLACALPTTLPLLPTNVIHSALDKFQDRVGRCPSQGLRYAWGGAPLWSTAIMPEAARRPPPCVCGAARQFELQLMPSLLFALKVDDYAEAPAATAAAATTAARPAPAATEAPPPAPPPAPAPAAPAPKVSSSVMAALSKPSPTPPPPAPADDAVAAADDFTARAAGANYEGRQRQRRSPGRSPPPSAAAAAEVEGNGEDDAEEDGVRGGSLAAKERAGLPVAALPQGMDWGVLAVYSCPESCEQSQEEYAVVQVPVE